MDQTGRSSEIGDRDRRGTIPVGSRTRAPRAIRLGSVALLAFCACSSSGEDGNEGPGTSSAGGGGSGGAQVANTAGTTLTAGAGGSSGSSMGDDGGAAGAVPVMAGAGGEGGAAGAAEGGAGGGAGAAGEGPTMPPVGKSIAFVAGNSNNTSDPGEAIGDAYIIELLETEFGHTVTVIPDSMGAADMVAAANGADLVIVAESTTSTTLVGKLKPVTTPILNYEAFIQDDLGMTDGGPPGDPGEPPDFNMGVKDNETDIEIVDPDHPLAAGLSGVVTVYSDAKQVTWGTVADTASVIAILPGDALGSAIYVYEKGATLLDGSVAAGYRIGYFLEDDNDTGTPNLMTDEGHELFAAAINWALSLE